MKKQLKLTTLVATLFLFFFVSCSDDDDTLRTMPKEEAKNEIRNASADIAANIQEIEATSAIEALMHFESLNFPEDPEPEKIKSFIKASISGGLMQNQNITKKQLILKDVKAEIEIDDTGIYEYNHNSNEFDLINDAQYLEISFPANDQATDNNAILRLNELETATTNMADDDEIITKIDLWLKIDNVTVMSLDFDMQLDSNDEPSSISAELVMEPYSINLNANISYSGNNATANSSMSMKENDEILMKYDLTVSGDTTKAQFENINGYVQVTPLKIEGSVKPLNIENHFEQTEGDPEVDYLNDQISISIIHTEHNKIIGDLKFFEGIVEDQPEIDIWVVYDDGSREPFEDAIEDLIEAIEDLAEGEGEGEVK